MKRHYILLSALTLCILLCLAPCPAQESATVLAPDDGSPVTFTSDLTIWYPGEKVDATGNVQVSFKDIKITGDSAVADLRTNMVEFKGGVKIALKGTIFSGEDLSFNMKTKAWSIDRADSEIPPSALGNKLQGPLYVKGEEIEGTERDIEIRSASLTTCNLPEPHYSLRARVLEIYPDVKIVARDVSVMGVRRKLFGLKTLVVPIRAFSHNIIPQIGSSAEEGMFLKLAYAYSATKTSQGYLKLDLMQLKGIGTGLQHTYNSPASSGSVVLYYLPDQQLDVNTLTGSVRHTQKLGTMVLNVNSNYRSNDYLFLPATTAQSWQVGLSQNNAKTNLMLNLADSTVRGTGTYETMTGSLRYTDRLSSTLTSSLSVDARSYDTSAMPEADRELNSNLQIRQRGKTADVTLTASKRIDLDGSRYTGDNNYSSLDRLPEVSVETDSYRMGRNLLGVPLRLAFTAGQYHETPSDVNNGRLLLEMDTMGQSIDLGSKNDLELNAGLRQAYYASDMQQYVLRYGGTLTTRYSDFMTSRLTYNYSRPHGYSPFIFDSTFPVNYSRLSFDYQEKQKLRWSLSTGYNFDEPQRPWQDVALRVISRPSAHYAWSLSTGYDLNEAEWRSIIGQFKVDYPNTAVIDLGARYNTHVHKMDLARTRVDLKLGKKWRLQGIASWNGITNDFDYLSARLIRDLHCMEAVIQYDDEVGFRTNRGITIGLRIKALPYNDRWGIGQYGQAVDTSMGDYFF